jgi:hypothetical protein
VGRRTRRRTRPMDPLPRRAQSTPANRPTNAASRSCTRRCGHRWPDRSGSNSSNDPRVPPPAGEEPTRSPPHSPANASRWTSTCTSSHRRRRPPAERPARGATSTRRHRHRRRVGHAARRRHRPVRLGAGGRTARRTAPRVARRHRAVRPRRRVAARRRRRAVGADRDEPVALLGRPTGDDALGPLRTSGRVVERTEAADAGRLLASRSRRCSPTNRRPGLRRHPCLRDFPPTRWPAPRRSATHAPDDSGVGSIAGLLAPHRVSTTIIDRRPAGLRRERSPAGGVVGGSAERVDPVEFHLAVDAEGATDAGAVAVETERRDAADHVAVADEDRPA